MQTLAERLTDVERARFEFVTNDPTRLFSGEQTGNEIAKLVARILHSEDLTQSGDQNTLGTFRCLDLLDGRRFVWFYPLRNEEPAVPAFGYVVRATDGSYRVYNGANPDAHELWFVLRSVSASSEDALDRQLAALGEHAVLEGYLPLHSAFRCAISQTSWETMQTALQASFG